MNIKHLKKIISVIALLLSLVCHSQNSPNNSSELTYYKLVENPLKTVIVKAKIGDSMEGKFVLDSGMSGCAVIDTDFFLKNVDASKLRKEKPVHKFANDCTFYYGDIKITIGNHTASFKKIRVEKLRKDILDNDLVGCIGDNMFVDKITVIDFDENKIAFTDSLKIDSSYIAIPFIKAKINDEWNMNRKFLEINGFTDNNKKKIKGIFMFDTGCEVSGIVMKQVLAKKIISKNTCLTEKEGIFSNSYYNYESMWRVDSLQLGNINIKRVPLRTTKFSYGETLDKFAYDGILGLAVLRQFNIIADYKHNIFYIKPNNYYKYVNELYKKKGIKNNDIKKVEISKSLSNR